MPIDTFIAKIESDDPDPQAMSLAAEVIREGGLVAFPTETVYGLGANALDKDAVAKIFAAKERPATDPLIVHIGSRDDLQRVAVDIPPIAHTLADAFWPGPLTLVLKKHPDVPDNVTAGKDTVAVRLPAHPIAQSLIRKAGVPIAAPSANRFSRPSPTRALHVLQDLQGRVDVILNGGDADIGVESSIVDVVAPVPTLLRPGGISLEQLRDYLPKLAFQAQYIAADEVAPAPGTLLKHYSPEATVIVFSGERAKVLEKIQQEASAALASGQTVGILAHNDDAIAFEHVDAQIVLLGSSYEQMATQLFAGLRALDSAEVDVIFARAPEQRGIGLALYDRLMRSAEGNVITVG